MEIEKLIERTGKYTKAEKEYLAGLGERYGIEPPKEGSCNNCWRDMAIRIAVAMKPKRTGKRLRGNAARDGVIFKGRIITNATLDDETLKWMEDNGFPETLLTDED